MSELDPETHALHDAEMAREATLQDAIDAVAAMGLGHDIPATTDALAKGIVERGLPLPPRDWLTAAAVEVAHGHRFVVGPHSEADAAAARDQR
jgi:hypothetical protein